MRWLFLVALAGAAMFSGCSEDSDAPGSGGSAGASGASAGAAGSSGSSAGGNAGVSSDASSGGSAGAATGGYMQICGGDGGFECDPGLTCKQYMWTTFDGGVSGCGRRLCTKPCGDGCPLPAIGCNNGTCEPPECYTP